MSSWNVKDIITQLYIPYCKPYVYCSNHDLNHSAPLSKALLNHISYCTTTRPAIKNIAPAHLIVYQNVSCILSIPQQCSMLRSLLIPIYGKLYHCSGPHCHSIGLGTVPVDHVSRRRNRKTCYCDSMSANRRVHTYVPYSGNAIVFLSTRLVHDFCFYFTPKIKLKRYRKHERCDGSSIY